MIIEPDEYPASGAETEDHCQHHTHDSECGGYYDDCAYEDDDDYCTHCECCCTCLGCEYGPRDGLLLNPQPTEDGRVRIR